jgi:hypothetical protein
MLLMHPENELLTGLLYNARKLESVLTDICESYDFYTGLATQAPHGRIEVRLIRKGIPHFFLTRSGLCAVIIQYQSSQEWGAGPTWRCAAQSTLYDAVAKEFEHLWVTGTDEGVTLSGTY